MPTSQHVEVNMLSFFQGLTAIPLWTCFSRSHSSHSRSPNMLTLFGSYLVDMLTCWQVDLIPTARRIRIHPQPCSTSPCFFSSIRRRGASATPYSWLYFSLLLKHPRRHHNSYICHCRFQQKTSMSRRHDTVKHHTIKHNTIKHHTQRV